jgi:hypothetical protein
MADDNGLSNAQSAYDIKLYLGDSADPDTANFTEIAEITDIGDFDSEWGTYDATNKQSQRVTQMKAALRTINDLEIEGNYFGDATQDSATGLGFLHAQAEAGARAYKFTVPTEAGTEEWRMVYWVKKFSIGGKLTDGNKFKATLCSQGVPALQ